MFLLSVGSNPVNDAVLIKVMLVSKGEGLPFPELPHEDEGGALEVVPLLRHLAEEINDEPELCIITIQ